MPGDTLVGAVCLQDLHSRMHAFAGVAASGSVCMAECTLLMQMMRVELTKFNPRFGIAKMSAKAYVGAALACEADLTLVLAK